MKKIISKLVFLLPPESAHNFITVILKYPLIHRLVTHKISSLFLKARKDNLSYLEKKETLLQAQDDKSKVKSDLKQKHKLADTEGLAVVEQKADKGVGVEQLADIEWRADTEGLAVVEQKADIERRADMEQLVRAENIIRIDNHIANLHFVNPVGLAAGFDKNAEMILGLSFLDFAFLELGTVTLKPQSGNPKPRLFRITQANSIINRMGFNNHGIDKFIHNLKKFRQKQMKNKNINSPIIGINIGRNKQSSNDETDYLMLIDKVFDYADYITVNISSPNTKGLRNLHEKEKLIPFIQKIEQKKIQKNNQLSEKYKNLKQNTYMKNMKKMILYKISPDIQTETVNNISEIAMNLKIDGLILANTSVTRNHKVNNKYYHETGGLSGKLIKDKSTKLIAQFYKNTQGKILLIGVGGIENAQDVYDKIKNGASLVQIYSGLIYHGFNLPHKINTELKQLIKKDGYSSLKQAIGRNVT